jgi:hypothetical protein
MGSDERIIRMLIPKIIHYVELGAPSNRPEIADCLQSVKELHPDWEIRTTRDNRVFDHEYFAGISPAIKAFWDILQQCNRCKNPLELKADLLRLCIVYCYGGIALDQDMYCLQPLDKFLEEDLLITEIRPTFVSEAVIGSRPRNPKLYEFINHYITRAPNAGHVNADMASVAYVNRFPIKPAEYFVPWGRDAMESEWYQVTKNTHCVHLWKQHQYDMERIKQLRKSVEGLRDGSNGG